MEQLRKEKEWETQTILTLMLRLVEHGFLRTERDGEKRTYFPLISKEEYLKFKAKDFIERFRGNSFTSLVTALYDGKKLKESDLGQLEEWLKRERD